MLLRLLSFRFLHLSPHNLVKITVSLCVDSWIQTRAAAGVLKEARCHFKVA